MGCHSLLQGIFPTQGSNPGLLHCKQTLYCLSHQGSLCPEVRVKPLFPLPVEQLHPQTYQQQGPLSSPGPTVPELLTQTGMSPICKDTMAVFCKPKMSVHILRLKPGDKTLECLTSGLVQKVGKMWSLFLGSTTSSKQHSAHGP